VRSSQFPGRILNLQVCTAPVLRVPAGMFCMVGLKQMCLLGITIISARKIN